MCLCKETIITDTMKRDRLDTEIEDIENDDSLTNVEKAKQIHEIEQDYAAAMRESAQDAYDRECEGW